MNTEEKLKKIILGLVKKTTPIHLDSDLKKDLHLDSVLLVQLAMQIDLEFSVDLGAEVDKGKKLVTFGDLLQCLT